MYFTDFPELMEAPRDQKHPCEAKKSKKELDYWNSF